MSTLRVRRARDSAGIFRRIGIEVDGRRVGGVRHGATAEFPVEPGRHAVRARMDWHSSPVIEVDVAADATTELTVAYELSAIVSVFRRSGTAIRLELSPPAAG